MGVIYRHHNIDKDDFTNNHLLPTLDKLKNENNKNIFISGDLNFNLLNSNSDDDVSEFLEALSSNYLLPSILLPTRVTNSSKTLIDNIFTNSISPDIISGNLTIGISDHLPSFMIIHKSNHQHLPQKHNIYKRDTKKMDTASFLKEISLTLTEIKNLT